MECAKLVADDEAYKLPGTIGAHFIYVYILKKWFYVTKCAKLIEDASVISGVEAAIASIGYGSARG